MAKKYYTIELEDDLNGEDFYLIAIQSYHYPYRLAYLLNQHFGMCLHKDPQPLSFEKEGQRKQHHSYTNRGVEVPQWCLFVNTSQDASHYIIPEYSSVNYFLKIAIDSTPMEKEEIIDKIHELPDIFDVYEIHTPRLKSTNYLLF